MHVAVYAANDLPPTWLAAWSRWQQADPDLASPFFSPEFTRAVERARGGVEVGVLLDDDQQPVGFFPFQRTACCFAQPVGAGFSEFHGVVAAPGCRWDVAELLRGCGLAAWHYDHVPLTQAQFSSGHVHIGGSPCIDLSDGFTAWHQAKRKSGSAVVTQADRKLRKLSREVGAVRFELHDESESGFNCLLGWKSAQHRRTGVVDVFERPWVVRLLDEVRRAADDDFRGQLSVLYAGATPVAVHLGIRSRATAHIWYPAYDPRFAGYSPGLVLLVQLTRALAEAGAQRIDLGPGDQPYKQRLKSGDLDVAIGVADRFPLVARVRRIVHRVRGWLRHRPVNSLSPEQNVQREPGANGIEALRKGSAARSASPAA